MLSQLIQRMAKGCTYNQADLARTMGISEGMLVQMIEELTRRGYVASLISENGCSGACAGCGCAKSCASMSPTSLGSGWTLTPQGLAYAKTHAA